MRRHIVEGEPGIFPSPVARVMQGIGGFFRRRRDEPEPDPAPVDDDPPPEPRVVP